MIAKIARPSFSDLSAGFSIFMIALPLSIGISIASGAPPTAGIVAAIIGGIVGSFCTGSKLTINGPAAGLIVIVSVAISELGQGDPVVGFRLMLACVVIAGILQIAMGLLKLGTIGLAFPSTVVHGMLAAIGLIIISKQVHIALGVDGVTGGPIQQFLKIPESFMRMNTGIAAIGFASLASMLLWSIYGKKFTKFVPPPLVAILVGSALGIYFDLHHTHLVKQAFLSFTASPKFLLTVPDSLKSALFIPDFSMIGSGLFWKHTIMITLVATAESILSTCAVDKLDPEKRQSDLNRDLTGKGITNMISGLIGGLPMISEIVRSSANVANGAKTQWSNFFHGLFLLFFLGTVPWLLHEIPVTSLAVILILVGYKLGAPRHFISAFKHGTAQGVVFLLTVSVILATDLLIGVLVGTLFEIIIVGASSQSIPGFRLKYENKGLPEDPILQVNGSLAFTNYLSLRSQIEKQSGGICSRLTLDLRKARVVDHTVNEHLLKHVEDFAILGKELRIKRRGQLTSVARK